MGLEADGTWSKKWMMILKDLHFLWCSQGQSHRPLQLGNRSPSTKLHLFSGPKLPHYQLGAVGNFTMVVAYKNFSNYSTATEMENL